MKCTCGAEVTTAEIRVVERCARGHFVRSGVAPARVDGALLAPKPMTPGQRRAFHAKAGTLDGLLELKQGTTKQRWLAALGIDSTDALSETEASDLLDQLEEEVAAAR